MEPLKEMFNRAFYDRLALTMSNVYPEFQRSTFIKEVTADLSALSLNERMRHTSVVLEKHLPNDYAKALKLLKKAIPLMPGGYTNLLFPDFVGLYGLGYFDLSMEALAYFTRFGSSEFAVRCFLKQDIDKGLYWMKKWAGDTDHHVRRLASEGSRPRLPWSFKLDDVIANPALTTPILQQLRQDPELYVRKSVANHLNDISKDHPEYMLNLVAGWDKGNAHTAWIVKHASRSLIKKGHAGSLAVFDFEKQPKVTVEQLAVEPRRLRIGSTLHFSFVLRSDKKRTQKLVVDYIIQYRKKNGTLSPKVFKLKELSLQPSERLKLTKKQVIKDFTTRKHFAGNHVLQVQVNGQILAETSFMLLIP